MVTSWQFLRFLCCGLIFTILLNFSEYSCNSCSKYLMIRSQRIQIDNYCLPHSVTLYIEDAWETGSWLQWGGGVYRNGYVESFRLSSPRPSLLKLEGVWVLNEIYWMPWQVIVDDSFWIIYNYLSGRSSVAGAVIQELSGCLLWEVCHRAHE